MKRLIRYKVTGWFFRKGRWTQDVHRATVFESVVSLLDAVAAHNLIDVEGFLLVGDEPSDYDIVFPIATKGERVAIAA